MKKVNAVFCLLLALTACSEKQESTYPSRKSITESVYASAQVTPEEQYKVFASVSGFLQAIKVKEGDEVKKGDLLFVISNQPTFNNEQNARLNYEFSKELLVGKGSILDELKLNLESAKVKMSTDSLNYSRFKELDRKQLCSQTDLENAKTVYLLSKNNYLSLQQQINRKQKELDTQLQQAKNNLNSSSLKTDDYLIRASISGEVFQLNKEIGELVNVQEPLALLGNNSNFRVDLMIDEVDISRVAIGQLVLITLEAYPQKSYEAKVVEISPKLDEKTQTFRLKAHFTKSPPKLFMGMTGEANIVVNAHLKSLVIPTEYLLPGNKVLTENGKKKVRTGLKNWSYVEILGGINEKTKILKPAK